MDTSDLTPGMQEMMAEIAAMRAEFNALKEQAQALPLPAQPSGTSASATGTPISTRRRALRRLAGGLLIGLAAGGVALTTGSGDSLAKTSVNPAGTNNQIGAFIVPPGKPLPTGIPYNTRNFGLIATDGNSLAVNNLPDPINIQTGVLGYTTGGDGVAGYASSIGGIGVYGYSNSSSFGYGVYGTAAGLNSYGGYFEGNVHLTGTLTGGTKSFKIDHPLDPANKYLYHTSVESPDMKNIYDGVVTLNDQGEATVEMPDWFESLNSDFRYQLTCLGEFSQVYIAEEIKERTFRIAGGKNGLRVSWQVTGIRQDAYAKAYRTPVEKDKNDNEKGKYIHPELFGQPKEMSVHSRPVAAK